MKKKSDRRNSEAPRETKNTATIVVDMLYGRDLMMADGRCINTFFLRISCELGQIFVGYLFEVFPRDQMMISLTLQSYVRGLFASKLKPARTMRATKTQNSVLSPWD
jgi:hypothetical protein